MMSKPEATVAIGDSINTLLDVFYSHSELPGAEYIAICQFERISALLLEPEATGNCM